MDIVGYETNCETGEVTPIYSTPEYLEKISKLNLDAESFQQEEEAKIASRTALLEKLGITEDEAKLLLG
jgi:hypothetical protein